MSKCKCLSFELEKFEKEYGIKVFQMKYVSPCCGTLIEINTPTDKGVGFKKWARDEIKFHEKDNKEGSPQKS